MRLSLQLLNDINQQANNAKNDAASQQKFVVVDPDKSTSQSVQRQPRGQRYSKSNQDASAVCNASSNIRQNRMISSKSPTGLHLQILKVASGGNRRQNSTSQVVVHHNHQKSEVVNSAALTSSALLSSQIAPQSGIGSKWKDLGDQHIVRATSIYTNIPLSQSKKLSVAVRTAQDKSMGSTAQANALANLSKTPTRERNTNHVGSSSSAEKSAAAGKKFLKRTPRTLYSKTEAQISQVLEKNNTKASFNEDREGKEGTTTSGDLRAVGALKSAYEMREQPTSAGKPSSKLFPTNLTTVIEDRILGQERRSGAVS